MNEMCSYYGKKTEVTEYLGLSGRVSPKLVKCPECGRKLKQKISACCTVAREVTYSIPQHKVKGWYKTRIANRKNSRDKVAGIRN